MSFPRYPEYKDSGVEWLGGVPAHWNLRKMRWLCEIKKHIAGEVGYKVLSITQQGIRIRDLESNDGQLSMDYSKYQFVEVGDFAMNHMDLLTGYADISTLHGVTSPDYRVFSIREPSICHDKYLLYLLQMGYKNKIFYAYGQGSSQLGRWRLPTEQFNELPFPLPPLIEQRSIADFLDCETVKIDALIAEQEQLIALLKEKRQAVISHAVTKGLNPDAPMKDSGIEWLGKVPAHWTITRLKHLGTAIIGLTYDPADIVEGGEGVLVLRSSNVQDGSIVFDDNVYVSSPIPEEIRTRTGDILICSRNGSRALIGKNAVIDGPAAGLTFGAFMTVFRSPLNEYLACIFNSPMFEYQSGAFMTSTINQLTIGVLNNMEIPLPPKEERTEIAQMVTAHVARTNTLIAEAKAGIALLKERRTALISAAVTGKIDVRKAA